MSFECMAATVLIHKRDWGNTIASVVEHSHGICGLTPPLSHVLTRVLGKQDPIWAGRQTLIASENSSYRQSVQLPKDGGAASEASKWNYIINWNSFKRYLVAYLFFFVEWPLAEMWNDLGLLSHPNSLDLFSYSEAEPKLKWAGFHPGVLCTDIDNIDTCWFTFIAESSLTDLVVYIKIHTNWTINQEKFLGEKKKKRKFVVFLLSFAAERVRD